MLNQVWAGVLLPELQNEVGFIALIPGFDVNSVRGASLEFCETQAGVRVISLHVGNPLPQAVIVDVFTCEVLGMELEDLPDEVAELLSPACEEVPVTSKEFVRAPGFELER